MADLNRLAARIVDQATGADAKERETPAQANGRAGGRKGGRIRAEKMTPEERSEAARKAALARWRSS